MTHLYFLLTLLVLSASNAEWVIEWKPTTEYSLNFNSPSAGLSYEYDTPVDFTNAEITFVLHPDQFMGSNSDGQFNDFIRIESTPNDEGLKDYFYMEILYGEGVLPYEKLFMATFETPKSSGDLGFSYCLTVIPVDISTQREMTISKRGPTFTLQVEGFDDIYCSGGWIGANVTGAMTMNKIKISSYKGCISKLQFPEINLLAGDGFILPYLTGDVTYFMGQCPAEDTGAKVFWEILRP